jgi:hypothetical protein
LADESYATCPLCGKKVPLGTSKCPLCATPIKPPSPEAPTQPMRPELKDDFLSKDLPQTPFKETKNTCPLCALDLAGTETKCPRCGVPLSQGFSENPEIMLECPECGAIARLGSSSCPKCGARFGGGVELPAQTDAEEVQAEKKAILAEPERVEASPVVAPEPPEPEVSRATPQPRPAPAQGLVNGMGVVNGKGLVNGTGITNGTLAGTSVPMRRKQQRFVTRWQFLAILVAIVIIIPTFIYLSYSTESTPFNVDGKFSEWSHVTTFGTYVQASSPSIDITAWSVKTVQDRLYLHFTADGALMSGTGVSSFYLFVDSDNNPTTGYSVSGIGAEYLIEIDGWNNSVQSANLYEYEYSQSDRLDWNSWTNIGTASAISVGSQLEGMAVMPESLSSSARFMLMSQNSLEDRSVSYTVPETGGLLVVRQEPGSDVNSSGIVSQTSNSVLMRLRLSCEGVGGTLRSISSSLVNAPLVSPISDIDLAVGDEKVVDVSVDLSGATPGSSVSASVLKSMVDSTFADVEILGDGVTAYVGVPPSSIVIDGAFGDWIGRTTDDVDLVPLANPNIDMGAVGAVNDSSASYFYVSVLGEMCSGSFVPALKVIPSGSGGGGIVIPTRKTGEDVLNIYIDSDMSTSTGYQMSLSSKIIGADEKIEIRGLDGQIVSKSLYVYSGGQWTYSSGNIAAAKDSQRIELSVSSALLFGSSSIDYIVETTDWQDRSDLATSTPQGSRAVLDGLPARATIESWTVVSPVSSVGATAMSYQRKLFYDGTNFWSFYWDGSNTVYRYSTDGGQNWTLGGSFYKTTGVNHVSIWYYAAGNIVYTVGDTNAASTNVYLQRGVVSPATHSISWGVGQDKTAPVSANALGGKSAYISRDAAGYLWIASNNLSGTSPVSYQLTVFRSAAVDTTSSWIFSGNMLSQPSSASTDVCSVVPTGSNVVAVYGSEGSVAARTFDGAAWSTDALIYDIGTGNPSNTVNAPPCVVVGGNGVVHVVYGDGHQQPAISKPYIYYVYYAHGTWSVPYRLDSVSNTLGNDYPTISLDASTGNLYAFWVQTDTSGVPQTVMCRKNVSGTWVSMSIGNQTAGVKQYLTSVYSVTGENQICFQWTQNTTAPIEVQFDKIPEFSDIALPLVFMIFMVGVFYRSGRARRKRH